MQKISCQLLQELGLEWILDSETSIDFNGTNQWSPSQHGLIQNRKTFLPSAFLRDGDGNHCFVPLKSMKVLESRIHFNLSFCGCAQLLVSPTPTVEGLFGSSINQVFSLCSELIYSEVKSYELNHKNHLKSVIRSWAIRLVMMAMIKEYRGREWSHLRLFHYSSLSTTMCNAKYLLSDWSEWKLHSLWQLTTVST